MRINPRRQVVRVQVDTLTIATNWSPEQSKQFLTSTVD